MTQLYPSEDTAQGYRRLDYRSVLMYARMENLKQVHVPHTDTHACHTQHYLCGRCLHGYSPPVPAANATHRQVGSEEKMCRTL